MADMPNVLAFMQSMPTDFGNGVRITDVSSIELPSGKHTVIATLTKSAMGVTIRHAKFFLIPGDGEIVYIVHGWGTPLPVSALELAESTLKNLELIRRPLGSTFFTVEEGRVKAVSQYAFPLMDVELVESLRHRTQRLIGTIFNELLLDVAMMMEAITIVEKDLEE